MEIYNIKNLSFTYPKREKKALDNVSFSVKKGEFITICGKSGCGKSTLLRLLKPAISPHGEINGKIIFNSSPIETLSLKEQSEKIGFILQNPDTQLVTDKVWHELAFGLESMGMDTPQIRAKVAEMASFFGISHWFYKKVCELSGGQKQLLNLASVMVMQPQVIILDEPTSQLDPIAAEEFLTTLSKINKETGTTIILCEHRLEAAIPLSDRVLVMDNGHIIADDTPQQIGIILSDKNHPMLHSMPCAIRMYIQLKNKGSDCPVTVKDGKCYLEKYAQTKAPSLIINQKKRNFAEKSVVLKDVWFRYEKELDDIIKDLNLTVHKGEIYSLLGGNGAGKTTLLSVISKSAAHYRGCVNIQGSVAYLPQDPTVILTQKTVREDLLQITKNEENISQIINLCSLDNLLDFHPYDLSGGEQQRAALAKLLLTDAQIFLLDEPTKGMDTSFKKQFAKILLGMKSQNKTVIMVSHDLEFCAEYSDSCGMFFDGQIVSEGAPMEFFSGKSFYTTAANRIAGSVIPNAILIEDIIKAFGEYSKTENTFEEFLPLKKEEKPQKKTFKRKIKTGTVFTALFIILLIFFNNKFEGIKNYAVMLAELIFAGMALGCFFPLKSDLPVIKQPQRKLSKRTIISTAITLILVPFTIFFGMVYLGDRKYYFISLLIILETFIPFFIAFEKKRPQIRELVLISVICAIAIAGRTAFYMLPQFKPVLAIIIICGVCFGAETAFLTGVVTGFVSNFFFGQGAWTPWQMFALGITGFLAGVLYNKGLLRQNRMSLCIFGSIVTLLIYGLLVNTATVLIYQPSPTKEMFLSAYIMGLPFDLIHTASTVFFLWVMSEPLIEKLERVKTKYGI